METTSSTDIFDAPPTADPSGAVKTVTTDGEGPRLSTKELKGIMFFELAQDKEGKWRWGLWTSNGVLMAMSAHGYSRRNDCRDACDVVMADVQPGLNVLVRDRP